MGANRQNTTIFSKKGRKKGQRGLGREQNVTGGGTINRPSNHKKEKKRRRKKDKKSKNTTTGERVGQIRRGKCPWENCISELLGQHHLGKERGLGKQM